MKIILLNVKIHNFLAFGDAELKLDNRGFCLLTGINKDVRDNAQSNGSGKSSLISAISWALTGETVNEVRTNIANIYLNNGCWVELTFDVDEHHYVITRYRDDPKYHTFLKIEIDGKDVSGKTLSDSEEQLAKYLPDLTSDLISSVIILGQGLPHKFSNYKPSGRKNLLEKLSKSDFMIEDIKNKICLRQVELNNSLRKLEDNKLSNESKVTVYTNQLTLEQEHLKKISVPRDFESEITEITNSITTLKEDININNNKLKETEEAWNKLNDEKLNLTTEQNNKINSVKELYNKEKQELDKEFYSCQNQINSLNSEITKLKSIKDVCPTCGQKIPGVIKQDTSIQEEKVKQLNESLVQIKTKSTNKTLELNNKVNEISKLASDRLTEISNDMLSLSKDKNMYNITKQTLESQVTTLNSNLTKLQFEKDSYYKNIEESNQKIIALQDKILETNKNITTLMDNISNISEHIALVKKLETLAKRDFRGYLLTNIITFIDSKAKDYASSVFGTNDLDFVLNGNNIDITYCSKDYELLSGGEKQKCDLCLQFALRDMMSQYLGFSSNILCLDEVFDGLDATSCDSVVNMISTKLNDLDTVFIISHRSGALGIPVDNEVFIEKNEKGISSIKD